MSVDCSDGEPVDDYTEHTLRATEETPCTACGLTIARGDLFRRTTYLFDGEEYQHDRCARCQALFLFLGPCVDQLSGDETVAPDLDCGHTWADNFEGEPPLAAQALAFLTPAEAQLLLEAPRFKRYHDSDPVSGPVEAEDMRLARLVRRILGDSFPKQETHFEAVEREDREGADY